MVKGEEPDFNRKLKCKLRMNCEKERKKNSRYRYVQKNNFHDTYFGAYITSR